MNWMKLHVVGIHASTAAVGIAVADITIYEFVRCATVEAPAHLDVDKRIDFIVQEVELFTSHPRLVVLECTQHRGLRREIRNYLEQNRIPFAVVTPAQRMKFITGRLRAPKEEVRERIKKVYGTYVNSEDLDNYRQANALALAAMGCRKLEWQMKLIPQICHDVLDEVSWPE